MKKYKFKIENITEKQIEIEAENNKKAVKKLAEFMAKGDENICENILEEEKYCYINLQEIDNGKRRIIFRDDDEININILGYLLSTDEEEFENLDEENEDEIEEENTKEHIEILCERCGNCILLDDIIHQLQS